MEGFGASLDGFYDVDDQLSRYLLSLADEHAARKRERTRSLDSRAAFEDRREHVRETILSRVGGLPDRPDDLAVETTGRVDRDGYAVETLAFRSRPDFHVTANCYVPDGDGPHPGILFLCGHVDDPRFDADNQRACIELASNGFVVLIVDPICQGERRQYLDDGEPRFGGSGGVVPHCYAGQKCFYAGANLARYLVHDDRCALDVLVDRSDVDADRIGVTGTSGGGLQTQFLAVVDDRVDAAAPCCSVRDTRDFLKTGKRMDAEQALVGALPEGTDHEDLLAAMAPDPLFVGAAASDQYFPIETVHDVIERTREVYGHYDAADAVDFEVADANHCSVYEVGAPVFEFLCDHLGDGSYNSVGDPPTLDEEALRVTSTGNVVRDLEDERTIDDLIRTFVSETAPEARGSDDDVDPGAIRRAVFDGLDLDRDGCALHPRYVQEDREDGLTVERVWFRTERDPDAVVAGVLVSDPDVEDATPAVVLFEDGTESLPERAGAVAELAREHGTAFVFDPRGVGAVRNRNVEILPWMDDYYGFYGTEFKLAYDALLNGTSLLGLRTYDAMRAGKFLRSEIEGAAVSFVGEGVGARHALYAAVASEAVERVVLHDQEPSFRELATGEDAPYDPQLTAFDVVGECDPPLATAALRERGVAVEEDPDPIGSATDPS